MGKSEKSNDSNDAKRDPKEIVARVVTPEIERGNLELWHTPSREAYASVKVEGHHENLKITGPEFEYLICHWIYEVTGEMPGNALLKRVTRVLCGRALYGSPEFAIHHRIAEVGGNIYVDLLDKSWDVIEVTPNGWWLAKNPPVKFIRSGVGRPLPMPVRGGNLDDLFELVNLNRREHRVLFLACLVATLQTHAAYPILMLTGSQGSAKSSACRILAGMVDPAEPQLVSGYSNERNLLVDAKHCHVIAVDNVSQINDELSDVHLYTSRRRRPWETNCSGPKTRRTKRERLICS